MEQKRLESFQYEDIEDWIACIEQEFNVKFDDDEFYELNSFGELCDRIVERISLPNVSTCTTQIAFYKIRNSLYRSLGHKDIAPKTKLGDLFPGANRIENVRQFETYLGFKVDILGPSKFVFNSIFVLLIGSTLGCVFYDWKSCWPVLVFTISMMLMAIRFGKELQLETVADLARQITMDHYLKVRSTPYTINKQELPNILMDKFNSNYGKKDQLVRESRL